MVASMIAVVQWPDHEQEALVPAPGTRAGLVVEYNILLSPVYRVPVLYFFLHGVPCTIETLYEHLVPAHSKGQAQDVGIMGGISMSVSELILTMMHVN